MTLCTLVFVQDIDGWWIYSALVVLSGCRYYILLHVMLKFALNEMIHSTGHLAMCRGLKQVYDKEA